MQSFGSLFNGAFGRSGGGPPAAAALTDLPEEDQRLPPFFTDILVELLRYKGQLGGVRNFEHLPRIERKVTKDQLKGFTNFEYVYLTVIGLANLHLRMEEIVSKCNGKAHVHNPGVQLVEFTSGMTMHGDREGAVAMLKSAPQSLLEAFRLSKVSKKGSLGFFQDAFDKTADPCLEGRVSRLLEYIEKEGSAASGRAGVPPWEDVSLRPLADDASPVDVVGEHLRVFVNECTWGWARAKRMDYEKAKVARGADAHVQDFAAVCNAATFKEALRVRGVIAGDAVQWECQVDDRGLRFEAYEVQVSETIERGRRQGLRQVEVKMGPKHWTYVIDLNRNMQVNPKTRKERPIRMAPLTPARGSADTRPKGQLSEKDLDDAIACFVQLDTLAPDPTVHRNG